MSKNMCSKRVIIRPGAHLQTAIQVAQAFERDYLLQETPLPLGMYHAKHYVGEEITSELKTINHNILAYHTASSIVIAPGEPEPEPAVGSPEPTEPEEVATK